LIVSQVSVSNWERGVTLPNPEYRERIEKVLSEKIEWDLDAAYSREEQKAVMKMLDDIYQRTENFYGS